jgi:hypothetical protein
MRGINLLKSCGEGAMKYVSWLVLVAAIWPSVADADNYEISVTRKGPNLYKIDGRDIFVRTRYCYEYVYSEESYLRMNGFSGEIIFLDAEEKCDVRGVYGKIDQGSGNYSVTVSHEDDDWYSVAGQDVWIKTSGCYNYTYGSEAVLRLGVYGAGTLYIDDDTCAVEAVYGRLRL